jgi:sensor histidine kinase YesM
MTSPTVPYREQSPPAAAPAPSSAAERGVTRSAARAPARSRLRGPVLWRSVSAAVLVLFVVRLAYLVFHDFADGMYHAVPDRVFTEVTSLPFSLAGVYAIVWLAVRRVPLVGQGWRRLLLVYGAAFVAFSGLHTLAIVATRHWLSPLFDLTRYGGLLPNASRFTYEAMNDALPYVALLGALALAENLLALRERERRGAELERSLLQAELRSLRLQLQPHFLFNALNTISATMYEDAAAADAQLGQLAELLRVSLRTTHAQEVPLHDELALLTQYLGLESARFGDRLAVDVRVDDDARECLVPSMVLQPLVENAVRHGGVSRTGRGRITVTARRDGDASLELRVHDDGPGAAALGAAPAAGGTGLSGTAQRVRLLYGDAGTMHAGDAPEGGFTVLLRFPARTAVAA